MHSFLHKHGSAPWPDDVATFPERRPGELVDQRTVLEVGGNTVRAYLDALAPDGTPLAKIEETLDRLADDLLERRNPTVLRDGSVTVRFGVELGLEPDRLGVLAELREELIALLSRASDDLVGTAP